MTILDKIIEQKKMDLVAMKANAPLDFLLSNIEKQKPVLSFREHILASEKSGIISEFKRNSPSKGPLNPDASVTEVTQGYTAAVASALSILPEGPFFHGHNQDLLDARPLNAIPILRKDFIVDEWQVYETRSLGADVMLLIASVLSPEETQNLGKLGQELGLEILLEVHDKEELAQHLNPYVDVVGVNNRNLKTFVTSIDHSLELADMIPSGMVKISESGLKSVNELATLYQAGYRGFLMGETFMRHPQPQTEAARFMTEWMEARTNLS
jgi:indole-3-glycerol phosphate synthase